ncbi:hypothetical protein ACMBCM_01675 [Spiroplasma sp. K1]
MGEFKMKKILNLLTALTISGVSIPKVTAFSSSSEQKKEQHSKQK